MIAYSTDNVIMQDVNLGNLLASLSNSSANPAAPELKSLTSTRMQPVSFAALQGQIQVVLKGGQRQPLLALTNANLQGISSGQVALSADGQSLIVTTERKQLLDTIVSYQQQHTLFKALANQPGVAKLVEHNLNLAQIRQAQVLSVQGSAVVLQLQPPIGKLDTLTVQWPQSKPALSPGQTVTLQVQQQGDKFVGKILLTSDSSPKSSPETPTISHSGRSAVSSNAKTVIAPLANELPILKQGLPQLTAQGIPLKLDNAVTQALTPLLKPEALALLKQAAQTAGLQVTVRASGDQRMALDIALPILKQSLSSNPVNTLSDAAAKGVMSESKTALQTLPKLPLMQERQFNTFFKLNAQQQSQFIQAIERFPPSNVGINANSAPLTSTEAASSINTGMSLGQKDAKVESSLLQQIRTVVKQQFVNADSTSQTSQTLNQALQILTQQVDNEVKPLFQQIKQALVPLTTQQPDARQLQQLLQLPATPISSQALGQISPVNNLVSGLVALLQLSLAARSGRSINLAQERVGQLLQSLQQVQSPTLGAAPPTANMRRSAQEFTQLEQRQQLLRNLSKALSQHSYNKLSQTETAVQGQESLFYAVPGTGQPHFKDTEFLIRRENNAPDNKKTSAGSRHTWHLTMLLRVGEYGDVLTKCRLQDTTINLDLYTNNEALRLRVLEHLPALKQRFTALGLEIPSSTCQLGVIPDTLRAKPYQILQTQV
ncbi:flagellar hook-length control protein FliK [Alteromonas flava]|uniref:flagellar hook-length control protein FliK n=1 Tax=Alteromonas flava TaxID=2048003 RepID=UPI000C28D4C2|nr:flagellar hook-length control protein FliK [Alteromonas flava]